MGFRSRDRPGRTVRSCNQCPRPCLGQLTEARDQDYPLCFSKMEIAMNVHEFKESKWAKAAHDPQAREEVLEALPEWMKKVRNSDLLDRARRLKDYLTSGRCSTGDLVLVVAALIYLISPIDFVPDFIPFAGWLDDVAIATMVLGYLDKKAAADQVQVYDV